MAGYFASDSMVVRALRQRAVALTYGQRALVMGALHPRLFVGTAQHTEHRETPYTRLGLTAHVYGDVAYTTCRFVASPAFGGDTLSCTNVLHRVDGVWKIVHHHADKSPKMGAALEAIARAG